MSRPLRSLSSTAHPEVLSQALTDVFAGDSALFIAPKQTARVDLPREVNEDIALVVQSSGTTGYPKLVTLSAEALRASARASQNFLHHPAQWLLALPASSIAGVNILVRSLETGLAAIRLPDASFTATSFLSAAEKLESLEHSATALVPAQLVTLLDNPDARQVLGRFRAVLVGGQGIPTALRELSREAGVFLVSSYGASETSGGCVYEGYPLGDTLVRIVDEEIWLSGAVLASGYLGDIPLTRERFITENGVRWFRSNDLGRWSQGTLRVSGRRDQVLNSGGVKIALAAIEDILHEFPGFIDAVVLTIPHQRWGERPVVVASGNNVDDHAALNLVAERLGHAARPERVVRVDEMPLLPSGKPDLLRLAELVSDTR